MIRSVNTAVALALLVAVVAGNSEEFVFSPFPGVSGETIAPFVFVTAGPSGDVIWLPILTSSALLLGLTCMKLTVVKGV